MRRNYNDTTEAIIDGLLKFLAGGGFLTTALIAPNAVQIFDKPLRKFSSKLDNRARDRELRRIAYYMKQKGWIRYSPRDYEHGIILTQEGKNQLQKIKYSNLAIDKPKKWDGLWRLVFFDIPEKEKGKRNALNLKFKQLGFQQLQISIWIHPFKCRNVIEAVCENLGIRKYVTYVEINHIDQEKILKKRFGHLI